MQNFGIFWNFNPGTYDEFILDETRVWRLAWVCLRCVGTIKRRTEHTDYLPTTLNHLLYCNPRSNKWGETTPESLWYNLVGRWVLGSGQSEGSNFVHVSAGTTAWCRIATLFTCNCNNTHILWRNLEFYRWTFYNKQNASIKFI